MLLTIDIGNTTVAVGGFQGPELRFVRRLDGDLGEGGNHRREHRSLHVLGGRSLPVSYTHLTLPTKLEV